MPYDTLHLERMGGLSVILTGNFVLLRIKMYIEWQFVFCVLFSESWWENSAILTMYQLYKLEI